MMSGDKPRVAVIGCGHLGRVHARIYNQMPEFELVAIADTDPDAAGRAANEYSCSGTTEPASLIGEVDAVSVVVPTTAHFEVALPFLENGVPVLLEKPIAATVGQAEQLVEVAAETSTPLLVGHLEQFNPALIELRSRLAAAPVYIEVQRQGPFVARAADVDVVTDLMIHDLDIISSLLGEVPASVQAFGQTIVSDHTDFANVRLVYPCGTVANITASRVADDSLRRMCVVSEDEYYELDYNSQQLLYAVRDEADVEGEAPRMKYTTVSPEKVQPLEAELAHFIDVIRNSVPALVPGAQGLATLRQVEQINAAIHQERH